MRDALVWLEQSALGELMRTSSLWTYPIVNLLHIFGIAALFGAATIIDLRLLGVWRSVPLAPSAIPRSPLRRQVSFSPRRRAWDCSPRIRPSTSAIRSCSSSSARSPSGLINVAALNLSPAWKAHRERELQPSEQRRLAIFGGISLADWITAVAAGRLIAYW